MFSWKINLSSTTLKVYAYDEYAEGGCGAQIGKIQSGECFAPGDASVSAPWEGEGVPVYFLNSSHKMTFGVVREEDYWDADIADFTDYVSNGTKWLSAFDQDDYLERTVKYKTKAYYADGTGNIILNPGSKVWLTDDASRGQKNPNYVAVAKVQKADGTVITFSGNGFVDMIYGSKWLRASNCILRKA